MPAAFEDDVADAVTALLNAGAAAIVSGTGFAAVTARHLDHWRVAKESLDAIDLAVVDGGYNVEPLGRWADSFGYRVDVGVRRNVASLSDADIRKLKLLTGNLVDYLRHPDRRDLATNPAATLVDVEVLAHRHEESLDKLSVYIGMARFTYQAGREST